METINMLNVNIDRIQSGDDASLTIRNKYGAKGDTVIVPMSCARAEREGSCEDVCLAWHVDFLTGIKVEISIRTDGSVLFAGFSATGAAAAAANPYAHFSREIGEGRKKPPTEGQRKTIARMYIGGQLALLGRVCPGAPVYDWAFSGMRPDDVSRMYGTGEPVYLA